MNEENSSTYVVKKDSAEDIKADAVAGLKKIGKGVAFVGGLALVAPLGFLALCAAVPVGLFFLTRDSIKTGGLQKWAEETSQKHGLINPFAGPREYTQEEIDYHYNRHEAPDAVGSKPAWDMRKEVKEINKLVTEEQDGVATEEQTARLEKLNAEIALRDADDKEARGGYLLALAFYGGIIGFVALLHYVIMPLIEALGG